MNTVEAYLVYLVISIGMTVWVARTLYKNGGMFLVDAFGGNTQLAGSVNHLLVVGFYLINLGYVSLNLSVGREMTSNRDAVETLARQVGLVLLVLGGMHFLNIYVFNKVRRRNIIHSLPPPVEPSEHLKNSPVEPCRPGEICDHAQT